MTATDGATDGATGASSGLAAGTSSVTVANSVPVFERTTYSTSLNRAVVFPLEARDDDGDALTYALRPGDSLPPGLTLTGAGELAGTPTQVGNFGFGLTVGDGRGAGATAKFLLVVSDAADGQGPVITNVALPTYVTRDQLAGLTLSGTARDVAPSGVVPVGVQRMIIQLRRTSDHFGWQPYEGRFIADSNQWYPAAMSAPTSDTTETRTWVRSDLSWVPDASVLTPGDYYIYMAVKDNAGNYSVRAVGFSVVAPPALALGLTATAGDGQITLLWDAAPGATGYQLFRSKTSGSYNLDNPVAITAGTGLTNTGLTNTGLTNGTTYHYVVRAFNQAGQSSVSNEASAIPQTALLSIDAHLRADTASAWLGEGFSNADAQGQTLTGTIQSGQTQTRQIRIALRGGDSTSKTVRVSVPDWNAFANAGWSARFYDAPQGGNDITSQITSNSGWTTALSDGGSRVIRVEASAPTSFAAGARGALTFRVEADPTSETSALDVVKAVWQTVAPTPDLSIRASSAGAYIGEAIINADGANQTLGRVAKPNQSVSAQIKLTVSEAAEGQLVKWSAPAWAAFAAQGWEARFYDAPQGGNDITAQITGEGWTTRHNVGRDRIIRVEASVPGSATEVTRVLGVRAQIGDGAASGAADGAAAGVADLVKLSVRVLANAQPDVAISVLDENSLPEDYTGVGELSPTPQQVETVLGAGETHRFALQITNVSSQTTAFVLVLPTLDAGWELKVYDAFTGGTLLTGNEDGIETPTLAPGQSLQWRVEVTANVPATRTNLPLHVSGGEAFDEVEIDAALQKLVGLQWSRDGKIWADVTANTKLQAQRYQSLGFRAVKSVPEVGWPNDVLGPNWQWQGAKVKGEKVWLSPQRVTDGNGEIATATLGADSFDVTIVVLPDVDLFIEAALGVMPLGETVAIAIEARDENNAPLANARVRLRCTKDGANSGHFGDAPSGELFLLTDAQGRISTTWTAGAVGRVQLSIEAVDSADEVFGEGDVWNMEVTN